MIHHYHSSHLWAIDCPCDASLAHMYYHSPIPPLPLPCHRRRRHAGGVHVVLGRMGRTSSSGTWGTRHPRAQAGACCPRAEASCAHCNAPVGAACRAARGVVVVVRSWWDRISRYGGGTSLSVGNQVEASRVPPSILLASPFHRRREGKRS
jgi:hypothetical protein